MTEKNETAETVKIELKPVQRMLAGAIADLLEWQGVARSMGLCTDPKEWLKDFCTLRLASHRRAGHTVGALLVLPQVFKTVAYVAPNEDHVDEIKRVLAELYGDGVPKNILIVSAGDPVEVTSVDCVVVDPASHWDKKEIESLYHVGALIHMEERPCAIVLLG